MDPNWPNIFEAAATKIKESLDSNYIAIHLIGA